MSINKLITDIFDDIFIKCSIINIQKFSLVCKSWFNIIISKAIICNTCNKIIKIYDIDLYLTDKYCLLCHGRPHPITNKSHTSLDYDILDISLFQSTMKRLYDEKLINYNNLFLSFGLTGMTLYQPTVNTYAIEIHLSDSIGKLNKYSYYNEKITFGTINTHVYTYLCSINHDRKKPCKLSICGTIPTYKYFIINGYKSKINTFKHLFSQKIDETYTMINLNSIKFNKNCMALKCYYILLRMDNNKLKFSRNLCDPYYCSRSVSTLQSVSKIGLLGDNTQLYYKDHEQLIFITEIKNFGKIVCYL